MWNEHVPTETSKVPIYFYPMYKIFIVCQVTPICQRHIGKPNEIFGLSKSFSKSQSAGLLLELSRHGVYEQIFFKGSS